MDSALQKRVQELAEELVIGVPVELSSVDATSLGYVSKQAAANALYEFSTADYAELCQILDIELKEEEEDESDSYGVAGSY